LDSIGSGTYKSIISGLAPNTTYYLRAYATNGVGTAYGNEITFKTTEVVVVLPIKSDTAESDEIAVKLPDLKNKTVFMSRIKEGARIQLNNIFFDHDKSTLREESIVELELLRSILMDNPTWLVEISGHTDDNGSEEHNLALSRARALAVVNYLVSNGINPKHMIAIGYGESKPAVENTTPENRQINRRTEFMILKTNVKHASTGGHGGKYKPLKLHNVLIESTLQGQDNSYKLKPEVHFINEGIDLTRYSRKQLDLVVAQLKDDKIFKLTLIPSVDVVGNEYNNKALYEKRAEKVLNYLVSKGLSRENITVQEFVPTNNPQETDLSKADIQKRSVLLFVSH
jgi:outer membrane protein OmpA-like peptidoglycan-associated protein